MVRKWWFYYKLIRSEIFYIHWNYFEVLTCCCCCWLIRSFSVLLAALAVETDIPTKLLLFLKKQIFSKLMRNHRRNGKNPKKKKFFVRSYDFSGESSKSCRDCDCEWGVINGEEVSWGCYKLIINIVITVERIECLMCVNIFFTCCFCWSSVSDSTDEESSVLSERLFRRCFRSSIRSAEWCRCWALKSSASLLIVWDLDCVSFCGCL